MNERFFYRDSSYWRRRESPWMRVSEAAFQCGMSEDSVRRYARGGAFVAIQPGRDIRINRASFEAWLGSRRYGGSYDDDE